MRRPGEYGRRVMRKLLLWGGNMNLIQLENIGKIYASEGNIAVGIRGVNLSFHRGEFVAVTGASGSGKSTLLNVLSGMDTYEEGELYIEGKTTSHYLQPDWEEYRQKYISFIFQNYNIIESFTVLQNVELALMTISDFRLRRKRAMELICRVGLEKHMHHKGSKLSGGQKQRTVIARALAKDSPIILADEPTGNLDSETAKEIVELLQEISKDKLVIVVTHNFEQFENTATRHVRMYDGAVESDRVLKPTPEEDIDIKPEEGMPGGEAAAEGKGDFVAKRRADGRSLRNGWHLGCSMFSARPKLSLFLVLLMILGAAGVLLTTGICGDMVDMFHKYRLFREHEGRLVVIRKDGKTLTDEELQKLVEKYGAEEYVHYDMLMDCDIDNIMFRLKYNQLRFDISHDTNHGSYVCVFRNEFNQPDVGRAPSGYHEVMLRLPLYYQEVYGKNELTYSEFFFFGEKFDLVGIEYYADTTEKPSLVFTREGFDYATMLYYCYNAIFFADLKIGDDGIRIDLFEGGKYYRDYYLYALFDPDMEGTKISFLNKDFLRDLEKSGKIELSLVIMPGNTELEKDGSILEDFSRDDIDFDCKVNPSDDEEGIPILFGPEVMKKFYLSAMRASYHQASILFASQRKALQAEKKLASSEYMAVDTDASFRPDYIVVTGNVLKSAAYTLIWLAVVAFLVVLLNLCCNRTLSSFREDMAIMRSMGIPVKVIRIGITVRMLLSQIPAFLLIPTGAYIIYHIPKYNAQLYYLQPMHYVFIYLGMLILLLRVTRKQLKNLFDSSVKTSLRGGDEA